MITTLRCDRYKMKADVDIGKNIWLVFLDDNRISSTKTVKRRLPFIQAFKIIVKFIASIIIKLIIIIIIKFVTVILYCCTTNYPTILYSFVIVFVIQISHHMPELLTSEHFHLIIDLLSLSTLLFSM